MEESASRNGGNVVYGISSAIAIKTEPSKNDQIGVVKTESNLDSDSRNCLVVSTRPLSDNEVSSSSNATKTKTNVSSMEYCRRVLAATYKPGEKATCSICQAAFIPLQKFGISSMSILAHVISHVNIPLYHCRHCDYPSTRYGFKDHLKDQHSISSQLNVDIHFVDTTEEHREEIFKMVDLCFGKLHENSFPQPSATTAIPISPNSIANGKGTSVITLSIQQDDKSGIRPSTTTVEDNCATLVESESVPASASISSVACEEANSQSDQPAVASAASATMIVSSITELTGAPAIKKIPGYSLSSVQSRGASVAVPKSQASDLTRDFRHIISRVWRPGRQLTCQECGIIFPSLQRSTEKIVWQLFQHVLLHVEEPLFQCCLCQFTTNAKASIFTHLKNIHRRNERCLDTYYRDYVFDYSKKILEMAKACYMKRPVPSMKSVAPPPKFYDGFSDPYNLCVHLARIYSHQSQMQCLQCDTMVSVPFSSVRGTFQYDGQPALDHALTHLGRSLYICKYCIFGSAILHDMTKHLLTNHRNMHPAGFINKNTKYRGDLLLTVSRCYDHRAAIGSCPPKEPAPKPSMAPPLPIEYCQRLIRKFQSTDSIVCQKCDEHIPIRNSELIYGTAVEAVDHALEHLNKPMFSCRTCVFRTVIRRKMREHLKLRHPTRLQNMFDDYTVMYGDEILSMLNQCFRDRREDYGNASQKPQAASSATTTARVDEATAPKQSMPGATVHLKILNNVKPTVESPRVTNFVAPVSSCHSADDVIAELRNVFKAKSSPTTNRMVVLKFRNVSATCIKCPFCQMRTKHKTLLRQHLKLVHSVLL